METYWERLESTTVYPVYMTHRFWGLESLELSCKLFCALTKLRRLHKLSAAILKPFRNGSPSPAHLGKKHAVLLECRSRGICGRRERIKEIQSWTITALKLERAPSYRTVMRILRDEARAYLRRKTCRTGKVSQPCYLMERMN